MKLEDKNFEDKDMDEEYEMVPFGPMMYGYGQMNAMPSMGMNQCMGMNPNMAMNPNMGIPMGFMQDVDPNMGMTPWMGTNSDMGINGFNQGMFMNGFDSMQMMNGEESMKDYNDDEHEMLRPIDKYGDNEPFNGGYRNPNKFKPKYNDIDAMLRRIERYNPEIFRSLIRCGMSYEQAINIVRRIVKLTLLYSEE